MKSAKTYLAVHNMVDTGEQEGSLDFVVEEDVKNYFAGSTSIVGTVNSKQETLEKNIPQMLILMGYNPVKNHVRTKRKSSLGIIGPDEIRYQKIYPEIDESWKNPVITIGPINYEKSIELMHVMQRNNLRVSEIARMPDNVVKSEKQENHVYNKS